MNYQQFEGSINIDQLIEKKKRQQELHMAREDIDNTMNVIFDCLDIDWDKQEFDRQVVKLMLQVAEKISNLKI